jgi:hypothetical protein
LTRSINKLLPDMVRKLEYCDEIADTESKAHRDLVQGVVIAAWGGEASEKKSSHLDCKHVDAMGRARPLQDVVWNMRPNMTRQICIQPHQSLE